MVLMCSHSDFPLYKNLPISETELLQQEATEEEETLTQISAHKADSHLTEHQYSKSK